MTTTIQKWGNSQGIRLPKQLLDALKWKADEEIVIKNGGNCIIIEQANVKKKNIIELFEGYNGDYSPEEIELGKSVGGEVW